MGVRAVTDSRCLAVFVLLVISFPYHLAAQNTDNRTDIPMASCPVGFFGDDCSRVCQSDQDCATEDSETCYSGFAFLEGYPTVPKVFSCTTTSPDLVTNLIEPGSVRVQCFSLEAAKTSNCSFTFGIVDYANQVSCEAVECDAGGNTISCGSIGCECVSDPSCCTGSTFVKACVSGV